MLRMLNDKTKRKSKLDMRDSLRSHACKACPAAVESKGNQT